MFRSANGLNGHIFSQNSNIASLNEQPYIVDENICGWMLNAAKGIQETGTRYHDY